MMLFLQGYLKNGELYCSTGRHCTRHRLSYFFQQLPLWMCRYSFWYSMWMQVFMMWKLLRPSCCLLELPDNSTVSPLIMVFHLHSSIVKWYTKLNFESCLRQTVNFPGARNSTLVSLLVGVSCCVLQDQILRLVCIPDVCRLGCG